MKGSQMTCLNDKRTSSYGLTLVELLVSLFVVGILVSLLLVAVQSTRESARKLTCVGNLRQIAIGISNYVSTYNVFPPGGMENGFSTHVRILPYVGLTPIHDLVDYSSITGRLQFVNKLTYDTPPIYFCPSETIVPGWRGLNTQTSYVGVFGGGIDGRENGVFVTVNDGRFVKPAYIVDGLSNTLLFIETSSFGLETADNIPGVPLQSRIFNMPRNYILPDDIEQFHTDCTDLSVGTQISFSLGGEWPNGSTGLTRLSCIFPKLPRNCMNRGSSTDALYTPSSVHPGAFTVVLADGAVRRFSDSIDTDIWRGLGTRDGGEVVTVPD